MKENRKLLKEVIKGIKRDMTDEDVLNLLADSKVSENPNREKDKYTVGSVLPMQLQSLQEAGLYFSFAGLLILWMLANVLLAAKAFDPYPFILKDRPLSDFAGDFQSVLPYFEDGTLDEYITEEAEENEKSFG